LTLATRPYVYSHSILFSTYRQEENNNSTNSCWKVYRVLSIGSSVKTSLPGDIVGVVNMVNSCLSCSARAEDWKNHCDSATGPTPTSGGYLVPQGDGFTTLGAWSDRLVAREKFVVKIPASLDIYKIALLMCPGTATYGPSKRFGIKSGDRVGIVGIEEPGHLAVMIAKAMGPSVFACTTSEGRGRR
jgi:uncharacterized zinc-type alcohol dehydrogenase-like protein